MATRRAISALAAVAALTACGGGPEHRGTEPLPFSGLDYGFPVQQALEDPRVAYVDVGSGSETLILVHGLASNLGFWRYNIPALAERYRVIAVDLPGYGHSEKSTAYPYTLSSQAGTLADLIDALDLRHVTLVGQSMGGQIAMLTALRFPEAVDRLVLVNPAGIEAFEPGEATLLRSAYTVEGIRSAPEDVVRRNIGLNFSAWDDRFEWMVEERVRLAQSDEFELFADAVVKSVGAMLDEPTTPHLERITQPTLIVYGENDRLIPNPYLHPGRAADVFSEAAARIPSSTLVAIPEAGHLSMMERPDAFNAALLDWLSRR